MKTNNRGLDLIKKYEKLKLIGYLPTKNDVPTIGWGSTYIFGRRVKLGETITIEDAEKQLSLDLLTSELIVKKYVKVPLTQNQFDALVSFIYNVGSLQFLKSTLLKKLNLKKYNEAADQFLVWNKQKRKDGSGYDILAGLTKRRWEERELFLLID